MTATDQAPLTCPSCRSSATMVGVQGNGLCFECGHTWDPNMVTALPVAPPPAAVPDVAEDTSTDVDTPADTPDPYAFPATWKGLDLFRSAGGTMTDEAWWEVRMGAPAGDVDPVPSMLDGLDDNVAVTVLLAEFIVKAGVASVNGQGADVVPGVPPTGYLPDDPAMHTVIEQAAAMAVGMLITTLHLDVSEIIAGLGGITYETNDGDPTTEEQHDTSTGNNPGPATPGDDAGGGDHGEGG